MQANLAAFYYDYQDKQLSVYFKDPIYTALARLQNIPKSEAYGIDGDVTWRFDTEFLTSNWTCIWGRGCQGILDEPAEHLGQGCCSQGAHLDGEDEAMLVSAHESKRMSVVSSVIGSGVNAACRCCSERFRISSPSAAA